MEWHFRNRLSTRLPYLKEIIHIPMRELWNSTLPRRIADLPVYADGALFVTTLNDRLYKLNPATGETLWWIKSEMPVGTTSPAYHRGRIYFSSFTQGVLYCVDSTNGREIWTMNPGGDAGSSYMDDNNLYLGLRKRIGESQASGFACYSLEDMMELWFHHCDAGISVRTCAVGNGILVYGDRAGNVYGLDTATGREIWKMKITDWIPPREERLGRIAIPHAEETPIIVNDVVLITADTPGQTFGLDLKSGKVLWLYKTEERLWNYHGMGVDDKNWYCLTMFREDPMQYISVEIKTGHVVLNKDISMCKGDLGSMNVFSRTGLVIGDYHFVGIYDPARIAAFNKNTGELVWTHSTDRSNLRGDGRGIYADGKLIWVRNTGDIYCFE